MVQKTKTVTILVGRGPGGGSRRLEMCWMNASAPLFGTKLTRPPQSEGWMLCSFSAQCHINFFLYTIQSNLSNTDTERTERSVRISIRIKEVTMRERHFYYSTYSFKCSVAKTRLTLVFKLHLKLFIHSTKPPSFSSIQHCTSQLQTNYCLKTKLATAKCCT